MNYKINLLSQIIKADPYPLLFILLSNYYLSIKNYNQARYIYKQGVNLFSKNPQIWNSWTFFEMKYGCKEIALHTCRETLDKDIYNSKAWRALLKLQIAFGAGDLHLVDVLNEALTACPKDPILRLQLAKIEEKRKGGKAALEVLKEIMHISHPDVMRMIGRILFENGDWNGGRSYLRRAADIDSKRFPNYSNNNNNSRTTSFNTSNDELDFDFDDSSMGSSLVSKQKSKNSDLLNNNNNNSSNEKKKQKFSRKQKAIKALHTWSLMESKVGNIEEARQLLLEAKALSQSDSGIWRAIAELESREKNYDEARVAFQNALSIDPQDARILLAWSRTEALAGDMKKSEELMKKVDKLPPNRKKGIGFSSSSTSASASATPMKRNKNRNQDYSERKKEQTSTNLSKLFDIGNKANKSPNTLDIVYDDDDNSDNESLLSFEDDNNINNNESFKRERNSLELTPHVLSVALRERAMMASREGRLLDCVKLLSRAINVDPTNETTWRLLASNELQRTGSIEKLRNIYKQSLEKIPMRLKYKIYHWWGQDERIHGNVNQARELFYKATISNPDYMSAWMSLGLLEKSIGNIKESCSILEQAGKRAETNTICAPYIFQTWGNVELKERNRIDVAASIFEKGVKLIPSSVGLWIDWGLLEYERGNFMKSRKILEKVISIDERCINSWLILAKLECDRSNFKSCNEYFDKALSINQFKSVSNKQNKLNTEDCSVLVSRAKIEGEILGNTAVARDLYGRALDLDKNFGQAWRAWGVMEMRCGNLNRAKDLFEQASLILGEEIEGWHLLGVLAWEKYEDYDEAVKMWKKVLEKGEDHAATYEQWGKMEIQMGNLDRGRMQFRKGFEIMRDEDDDNLKNNKKTKINKQFDKDGYIRLLMTWGWMEVNDGKWKKAGELSNRVLKLDGRCWEAWELLAEVEGIKYKDATKKLNIFKQGIQSCRGKACGQLYLKAGETIMIETGDLTEARKFWKNSLNAKPADKKVWKGLTELEQRYVGRESAETITKIQYRVFSRRLDSESDIMKFISEE